MIEGLYSLDQLFNAYLLSAYSVGLTAETVGFSNNLIDNLIAFQNKLLIGAKLTKLEKDMKFYLETNKK